MSRTVVWTCLTLGMSLMSGTVTGAPQFVPPAGYSGKADHPGVATPAEPGTPALGRVPDASLSTVFEIDPAYVRKVAAEAAATPDDPRMIAPPSRHRASAQVKVVGAFAVTEPPGTRLVSAWARGFLPVTLAFSDGRCFALKADYFGGTLSNGRFNRVACDRPSPVDRREPPSLPTDHTLRLIDSTWGLQAWANDAAGLTVVTVPDAKTFQPLFTARMSTIAAMAMLGIDYPGGNITLVGRIGGRLMVITLEFSY